MATVERDPLTRTQYVGKDFDTIFDDLVARAKTEFADTFNDFAESSPGVMFMDLVAYATGSLAWYMDRQATEVYLDTVRFRVNAARISRMLGYKPARAASASTDLSVELAKTYSMNVTLPAGFQIKNTDGLVFEAASSAAWVAGDISAKTLTVSEGVTKRAVFVSDGTENQRFTLPGLSEDGTYLVGQSCVVTVAGVEWDEVELMEVETTDQFEVEYDEDPPVIRFGDGLAGNVPASGAEIRVSYRIGHGDTGNLSSGQLTKEVAPLIVAGTTIKLTITQPEKATGGSPPETLASIKANAPRYFAARGVAVTISDYKALVSSFNDPQYGRVAMVGAINTRGSATDTELQALMQNVTDAFQALQTYVQTRVDGSQSDLADIDSYLEIFETQRGLVEDETTNLATYAASIASIVTLLGSYISVITDRSSQISERGQDIIDRNADASDVMDASAIQTYCTQVDAQIALLQAQMSALLVQKTNVEATSEVLDDIEFQLLNNLGLATARSGTIATDLSEIETELTAQDAAVATALTSIEAHFDEHLSSASEANMITVPVLAKDADGFFTTPSNGLMLAVADYLESVKDVTHTVNVVSGEEMLVEAEVTITLKVSRNYVASSVIADVEAAVLELLKDREFGETLFLQEVYDVRGDVEGVDYMNVTLGPSDKLDGSGNLVPDADEVITNGTVSVAEVS